MVENLGPQAAHDVNGYRCHLDSELVKSSIQSLHIAISGGNIGTDPSVRATEDLCISNVVNESVAPSQSTINESTREIDGGLFLIRLIKSLISDSFPSTTIFTPASPKFRTNPVSERDSATL